MEISQAEIEALVAAPAETRAVEIKAWIDPRTLEGKAKLLKALFALRNFNGGRLVIGFEDGTLQPLPATRADILDAYHNDDIQALVSKHASETFDLAVCFGSRAGQQYPVIAVDSGIRTPVAVKAPVTGPGGSQLLAQGSVFFRTLNASGVASSAAVQHGDWPELMQICMDNREADIGRFVRRHLAGLNLDQIVGALGAAVPEAPPSLDERARSWLQEGATRAAQAAAQWPLQPYPGNRPDIRQLLEVGAWEVGMIIDPPVPGRVADAAFYRTVANSVPELSGWPIWLGTRHHEIATNRHVQVKDGWEAFIVSILQGFWDRVEFQRWEPTGRFYLRRLHDDDASAKVRGTHLKIGLDLGLVASRVAEAMIAGLSIAKALGCPEDSTTLGFDFRWTGLSGRVPIFWASTLRYSPMDYRRAVDDDSTALVSLPLATAPSAVTPFVDEATRSLFAKFDGFTLQPNVIENRVRLVFERKT